VRKNVDAPNRANVLDEQPVRVAHVARVQRLDAQYLRTFRKRLGMITKAKDELRGLLFGNPLLARERLHPDALSADLDACLRGAILMLAEDVGECTALDQARLEWSRIVALPADGPGIAAKRAALLFALHKEPSLRESFAGSDPELVADLEHRVLPMSIPSFVAGMGQCPDSLVALVCTLCELWPGEPMGMNVQDAPEV